MTANEVIDQADALQPNTFTRAEKQAWCTRLTGILQTRIWNGYAEQPVLPASPEEPLPVETPWEELYLRYLQTQMDLGNGELTRYENSAALYNRLLSAYRNHYNRTHTPLGTQWCLV